jgi:hypothetical protein
MHGRTAMQDLDSRAAREALGLTRNQFELVIEKAGLEPVRRAGNCRMWAEDQVAALRERLANARMGIKED